MPGTSQRTTALRRHGVHSAHRCNAKRPIQPPPADVVEQWWDTDATIIRIARSGGVSVNAAAIWLAKIDIFVNDTPAICRRDLLATIAAGDSLETIRRRHHVTEQTVVIDLRRPDLFDAHRRRHITAPDDRID